MSAWQFAIVGFSCIASMACSFCAWYIKKIVTDIEEIKIMLAKHSEVISIIKEKEII